MKKGILKHLKSLLELVEEEDCMAIASLNKNHQKHKVTTEEGGEVQISLKRKNFKVYNSHANYAIEDSKCIVMVENKLLKIPHQDVCFRGEIEEGTYVFFDIQPNFSGYSVKVIPSEEFPEGDIVVQEAEVFKANFATTKNPYSAKLTLSVKGEIRHITVDAGKRYYKKNIAPTITYDGVKSETENQLYPVWRGSGFVRTAVVPCVGPMGTGKSTSLRTLENYHCLQQIKDLIDGVLSTSQNAEEDCIVPFKIRTPLTTVEVKSFAYHSHGKTKGILYLVDLAGELTHLGLDNQDGDRVMGMDIITNMGEVADAVLLFYDDRHVRGEQVPGNNYNVVANFPNNMKYLHVINKADELKKSCGKKGLCRDDGHLVLAEDNPVFESVARLCRVEDSKAERLIHRHMAVASDLLRRENLPGDSNNVILVNAITPVKDNKGNQVNQKNTELILAVLTNMVFGAKYKTGGSDV